MEKLAAAGVALVPLRCPQAEKLRPAHTPQDSGPALPFTYGAAVPASAAAPCGVGVVRVPSVRRGNWPRLVRSSCMPRLIDSIRSMDNWYGGTVRHTYS